MPEKPRQLDSIDPPLRKILRELVEGRRKWPLFLFGPAGRGKSSACLAVADCCRSACFFSVEQLADMVMAQDADQNAQMWRTVSVKDLAVLDEIGAREKTTDLTYTSVLKFASTREDFARSVAFYIGNVGPNDLPRLFDDRVASRILSGTVYKLDGRDRRHDR